MWSDTSDNKLHATERAHAATAKRLTMTSSSTLCLTQVNPRVCSFVFCDAANRNSEAGERALITETEFISALCISANRNSKAGERALITETEFISAR